MISPFPSRGSASAIVARRDDGERFRRLIDALASDHAPDRGILGTQAPHRVPRDAERLAGDDLVIGGDRVEIPRDVIGGVGVRPACVRIERDRIEVERLDRRIAHRRHHLLEGERLPVGQGVAVIPVVAVRAHGEDRLVGGDELEHPLRLGDVPILARDRAGIAFAVVLVVQHEEDVIVRLGVARELIVGVVERDGLRDAASARREGGGECAREDDHVGREVAWDLFEVDRDAGEPIVRHRIGELVDGSLARRAVGEQMAKRFRIPLVRDLVIVAHHEEHGGPLRRIGDHLIDGVLHAAVDLHEQRVAAVGDECPLADDPVEIVGVIPQRSGGVVVPVDVEADDDRVARLAGRFRLRALVHRQFRWAQRRRRVLALQREPELELLLHLRALRLAGGDARRDVQLHRIRRKPRDERRHEQTEHHGAADDRREDAEAQADRAHAAPAASRDIQEDRRDGPVRVRNFAHDPIR